MSVSSSGELNHIFGRFILKQSHQLILILVILAFLALTALAGVGGLYYKYGNDIESFLKTGQLPVKIEPETWGPVSQRLISNPEDFQDLESKGAANRLLIFPVYDEKGVRTKASTILQQRLIHVWKVYAPENISTIQSHVINNHLDSISDFPEDGSSYALDKKAEENIRLFFNASHTLHGTYNKDDDEYTLTLELRQPTGNTQNTFTFTEEECLRAIDNINKWIVEEVDVELTQFEQKALTTAEYHYGSHIDSYEDSRWDKLLASAADPLWGKVLESNPDIYTMRIIRAQVAHYEGEVEVAASIDPGPQSADCHPAINVERGILLHAQDRFPEAFHEFTLAMLKRPDQLYYKGLFMVDYMEDRWRNHSLIDCLKALEERATKNSHFHYSMGVYYRDIAWAFRGTGWASTVSNSGWVNFNENLERSEEHFEQSIQQHPQMPNVYSGYFSTLGGLGKHHRIQVLHNDIFSKYPDAASPTNAYINFVRPRWGGSIESGMDVLDRVLEESSSPFAYRIVHDFHTDEWRTMYRDENTYEATKAYFDQYPRAKEQYRRAIERCLEHDEMGDAYIIALIMASLTYQSDLIERIFQERPDGLEKHFSHVDTNWDRRISHFYTQWLWTNAEWKDLYNFCHEVKESDSYKRTHSPDETWEMAFSDEDEARLHLYVSAAMIGKCEEAKEVRETMEDKTSKAYTIIPDLLMGIIPEDVDQGKKLLENSNHVDFETTLYEAIIAYYQGNDASPYLEELDNMGEQDPYLEYYESILRDLIEGIELCDEKVESEKKVQTTSSL